MDSGKKWSKSSGRFLEDTIDGDKTQVAKSERVTPTL
jgi:hypothetical protein